jgi:hypothetical protein
MVIGGKPIAGAILQVEGLTLSRSPGRPTAQGVIPRVLAPGRRIGIAPLPNREQPTSCWLFSTRPSQTRSIHACLAVRSKAGPLVGSDTGYGETDQTLVLSKKPLNSVADPSSLRVFPECAEISRGAAVR